MLTRPGRRAAEAAVAVLALVFLAQVPALAGGPGGGGPFGHVQCGQSYAPSCSVSAGSPGTPGTSGPQRGGTAGTPPASSPGSSSSPAGGAAPPPACNGSPGTPSGCVLKGCSVTRQKVACPAGLGAAPPKGRARPAPPPPGVLARLAVRYLRLPSPQIRSSPAQALLQLTRLPVWLWIAPAAWQPQSKTASVPGESVTATATPASAAWETGDGDTVTCKGPGTPYTGGNPAASSPTCGHTYQMSSAGQPGGAYPVTVTVTWAITWTGPAGAGGALAPLHTAAATRFRVAESQALNTGSGG